MLIKTKTKKPLLAAAMIAAGMMVFAMGCLRTAEPFDDAVYAWEFSDLDGLTPGQTLTQSGAVRVGVDLPGDAGRGAFFEGGFLESDTLQPEGISPEAEFSFCIRFMMTDSTDGVLFELGFEPEKERKDLVSFEMLTTGHTRQSYIGTFVNGFFIGCSGDFFTPGQWYTAVVRSDGQVAQFIVDGVMYAQHPLETGPSRIGVFGRPFKGWFNGLIRKNGLTIGNGLRGKYPFQGAIDRFVMWDRYLSDAEVQQLSGVEALESRWDIKDYTAPLHFGLHKETMPDAERVKRWDADVFDFYPRALREDKYFPRFHLSYPGFCEEVSATLYVKDRYHFWPHGSVGWWGFPFSYGNNHFNHIYSEDLVSWRVMPSKNWRLPACNFVEHDGRVMTFRGGFEGRYVGANEEFSDYILEEDVTIPVPPHGVAAADDFTFKRDGQWFMIKAHAGGPLYRNGERIPTLELYRAVNDDLTEWAYEGPFYTGTGLRQAHHPNMMFVDGKVVVWSLIALDEGSQYTVGRIENNRFIKEGTGDWGIGLNTLRAAVMYESNDSRILLTHTIWGLRDESHTTKEALRAGWDNVYSIPREVVGLRGNQILSRPAEELKKLRGDELARVAARELSAGQRFTPAINGETSQFELSCRIALDDKAQGGIELLGDAGDRVRIYYDSAISSLVIDTTGARHASFSEGDCVPVHYDREKSRVVHDPTNVKLKSYDTQAVKRTYVELEEGAVDIRLFFDRSIIEVFANGTSGVVQWRPESPEAVQLAFFSDKETMSVTDLAMWRMGTIWKDYID